MGLLSLGALALLFAAMHAMAWSLVLNTEGELGQQHRDEEDNILRGIGSGRYIRAGAREGKRGPRQLDADQNLTVAWVESGRASVQAADAQGQGRDYLNGLVENSVASTDKQEGDVVFVKTHKTGSTSLSAILYRYAIRHDLRIAQLGRLRTADIKALAEEVEQGEFQRVDIMHYHISPNGKYHDTWSDARESYRGIMRDPDNINFITVLREPRSHFLSFYYYYLEPVNKLSIEDFLAKGPGHKKFDLLRNTLSSEFGVTTQDQLEHLIANDLPSFKLVFLTERYDEGLMVLRRVLGWSMIDMTYMSMKVSKAGAKRWDGKPLVDRPSFDDLPEEVQNQIDKLTKLDRLLHTAAKEEYEKRLQPLADVIAADLEEFQGLQNVVRDYLDANHSSKANAMYRAEDYFDRVPPLNPF